MSVKKKNHPVTEWHSIGVVNGIQFLYISDHKKRGVFYFKNITGGFYILFLSNLFHKPALPHSHSFPAFAAVLLSPAFSA